MKRKKLVTVATAICSLLMSSTVFAGSWQTGTGKNQGKWWYDNGNGSYTSNGWQWIDGNGDGTAESYYFDENGWLLTNTTTPDGYTVNGDGAWVENGVIQTNSVPEPTSETISDGTYHYCRSELYVKNELTGTYELYKTTPEYTAETDYNTMYYGRQEVIWGGDFATKYELKKCSDSCITLYDIDYSNSTWSLSPLNGIWKIDSVQDELGQISTQYMPSYASEIIFNNDTIEMIGEETDLSGRNFQPGDGLYGLEGKIIIEKRIFKK